MRQPIRRVPTGDRDVADRDGVCPDTDADHAVLVVGRRDGGRVRSRTADRHVACDVQIPAEVVYFVRHARDLVGVHAGGQVDDVGAAAGRAVATGACVVVVGGGDRLTQRTGAVCPLLVSLGGHVDGRGARPGGQRD